ncbi:hypothetical protein Tco_0812890 [Tanacetum coccineum]
MLGNKRSRDMTKYCHFYEDYGHETNDCHKLRHQIDGAVKSGQISHLVKGIKKGKAKDSDTQHGNWKKGSRDTAPVEAPILMISRKYYTPKRKPAEEPVNGLGEITFLPVSNVNNSSDLIIIGIHIFEAIKNENISKRVSKFMRSHLRALLSKIKAFHQITHSRFQGFAHWLLKRTFLAYQRGLPGDHNRRTSMQKMGIVVSKIHGAIKFHTPRGIDTVFSTYEPDKVGEGQKKLREASSEVIKGVLSCIDAEERIIVNEKYQEQTVIIGKQLPTNFEENLRDL